MPTRRQTIIGTGNLLVGGLTMASGAFDGGSTTPAADFRVIAPPGLVLVPGRDDHAHVMVEDDGAFEHVISIELTQPNGGARTRFEHIVKVVNNLKESIEELYFTFEVESQTGEEADIRGAVSIVSTTATIPGNGDVNYLEHAEADGDDPDVLEPGEGVAFGVQLDLQPTNEDSSLTALPDPSSYEVTLRVSTTPE